MSKIKSIMDMAKLKVKAKSPEICFITGIGLGLGSIVLAARAGMKTPSILEQRRKEIEEIENALADEHKDYEYTEEDAHEDVKRANKIATVELLKVYSPVAALAGASLFLLYKGQAIQAERVATLSTALNSTQAILTGYRERVATYLGKEKEEQVFRGMKKSQSIDPETGELHETETIDPKAEEQFVIFERVFDDTSKLWKDEAWTNQNTLYDVEAYLNRILQERALYSGIGVLTFNEALKMCGIPQCPEGFTLGWWYSDDHRSVISLGLDKDSRFINGLSKDAHLTFNVEGDILKPLRERNITKIYSF